MLKSLIIDAFKKGEEHLKNQGVASPTNTAISEFLSTFLTDDFKTPISSKTLRNYYKSAQDSSERDISISRADVIQSLCEFLNYESFKDYSIQHGLNETTSNRFIKSKTYWVIGGVAIGCIVLFFLFFYNKTEPRLMVWDIDHYKEVKLDLELYDLKDLKYYKQERIDHFKKVLPDCNYAFFNDDGSVKIWYGKNRAKQLEYFTDLGLHPETGKTLKPITKYMIKTHICE